MPLVTTLTGEQIEVTDPQALAYYRGEGYPIEGEDSAAADAVAAEYDPGSHTVADVNTYLAGLDVEARARVLAVEAEGQARVGILNGPHAVFDPSQHTVEEVAAYLARGDVDDAERQRVLDAELAGEARKGVLGD